MRTPEFSEFSFGYALTDSLISALRVPLGRAPVFPSLIAEGSVGGGYDIELPSVPFPLFIQFKIPQVLNRSSAFRPTGYSTPYYRMPLRTQSPNQHQLLLNLESSREDAVVAYATPLFHELRSLDRWFVDKTVHQHSAFILPSTIGPLDDKHHTVSYRPGARTYWLRSEPKPISIPNNFEALLGKVLKARSAVRLRYGMQTEEFRKTQVESVQRMEMQRTVNWLRQLSADRQVSEEAEELLMAPDLDARSISARIGYFSQVHLGLTVAWLEAGNLPNRSDFESPK